MVEDASLAACLRAAAPDRQVEAMAEYLRTRLGVVGTDVLLADYRIAGLWAVLHPSPAQEVSLAGRAAAARCFSSQQALVDAVRGGVRVYLPLTVWGERLGVLAVELAEAPTDLLAGRLNVLAGDLALALRAADRDTDRYRRVRRRGRLSMAAELQWDLIPGRSLGHASCLLAGQLEPAYTVGGDNFDWALNDERLTVTAVNGDGTGLPASLLTALAVNAMRNARRSGGSLAEQAELASDTIYRHHRGGRHLATLLLELDVRSGRVLAVDAGSPRVFRVRGAGVHRVVLEEQLPLGMFEEGRYTVQQFRIEPGDRLFLVSDGVYAAAPGEHEPYGDRVLARAIRSARLQPATEAVGTVMRDLRGYHGDTELDDDAVIVCLDWYGMNRESPG
ncbi:PP2C family protein-serine/threonine phosphatase [Plantactinospora sp. KBS50]|uniref:PP2C family protein-serine/threonine phosphatase n=1 Tax=Plantactinospora sp. KBS50 TaxID=2024580 RepID=UPI000BAAC6EA|nr:PP2C family protein-serine/threonine phosphatase [Plantactinospora sp. KBS50]ASW55122.1 protein phosphatase [Plantactinospora sp. KBS50]